MKSMSLERLKRQLKQQNRDLKKSRSKRKLAVQLGLLLLLIASLGWPSYRHYRAVQPITWLREGDSLLRQGQVEAARQRYQQIYQHYPAAEQAPEALFRCGNIWLYDLQQEQQAILSFLQLEYDYPQHRLIRQARETVAWIRKVRQQNFSAAIEIYQNLLDQFPQHGDTYLFEIADSYFRLGKYSQARIEWQLLLEKYPQSHLAAEALYRKGGMNLLEKRHALAKLDWQTLIDSYPDSPLRIQAQFNLAKILEENGFLEKALDAYRQLTDYPEPLILEEKINYLQQRIATKNKAD